MRAIHKIHNPDPVFHIPCKYPGCQNVRETSNRSERKWVCTEHIHFMPYVQEVLIGLDEIDKAEDKRRADRAFALLKSEYESSRLGYIS